MKRALKYSLAVFFFLFCFYIPIEASAQKVSDLKPGDVVTYSEKEWVYLQSLATKPQGLFLRTDGEIRRYYYNSGSPLEVNTKFDPNDPLTVANWLNETYINQLEHTDWIQIGVWDSSAVPAQIGLPSREEAELNKMVILNRLNSEYDYYTLTAATDYDINIMNVRSRENNDFVSPVAASVGNILAVVAPAIYLHPDLYVYEGQIVSCLPPNIVPSPAATDAGNWIEEVSVTLEESSCYNGAGNEQYRIQDPDGNWGEWENYVSPIEFDNVGHYVLQSRMSEPGSGLSELEIRVVNAPPPPPPVSPPPSPPVSPPPMPVNMITPAGGTWNIGGITFQIPANAVNEQTLLNVERIGNIGDLPESRMIVSDVFEITKNNTGDFNVPITIMLPFDASAVEQEADNISIFWLNEETGEWVELENVQVHWQEGKVAGEVNHFTKFAVLVKEEEEEELPFPPFTDIKGHWAADSITELFQLQVINGYSNGTFRPDRTMTRAEFISVLVRAFEMESTTGKVFKDTENHWARDNIATAYELGLIDGYNETLFGANDPINREQIAKIMWNVKRLEKKTESPLFSDKHTISPWAVDAVETLAQYGIIRGYTNGSFKPKASATRAEAVVIISRFMDALKKND